MLISKIIKFSKKISVILLIALFAFLFGAPFFQIPEAKASVGIDVEKGSFTRQGTTGEQTISLTDSSLTPKVVIFFGTNQATEGTLAGDASFFGYMVNATQQRSYATGQANGVKGGFTKGQEKALLIIDTGGVIVGAADWVSFNAGNFVIDWTTNDGAVANIIHYIAIGGDTLANVNVGDFAINTTTGNQAVTGVGFQPKLVLFMGTENITAYPGASTADSNFFGMAKSSTARGGMSGDLKADKTSTTQRTDRAISIMTGGGALGGDADFVSMNSDGFTINITDAPVLASKVAYLALGGANLDVDVGSFNQPTSIGVQTITTTHEPKVVYLQSWGKVASTAFSVLTTNSWGAAASTTQEGSTFFTMNDLKDNYNGTSLTKAIQLMEATVPVDSAPTMKAEADFDSFTATSFKIDWTTVDAIAREVLFWTLGAPDNFVTAGTALTQPTNVTEGDTAVVIGAFTFIASPASATITSIKINEEGTVNANSNLTNVKLYSQQEATCTFADSTQLGTTQSFDGSDEATFGSLSLSVDTVTQQCVFVVVDVGASAGGNNTIEIEITTNGDVVATDNGTAGSFPVQISGSTNIRADSGTIMSPEVDFDWTGETSWGEAVWSTTETQGDVVLKVYYTVSTACDTIVPDGVLSGNSTGFQVAASPLDISGLNTTTYNRLCLKAELTPGAMASPTLNDWKITWEPPTGVSTLTFSILDNDIFFGNLSTSASKWADNTADGSTTAVVAHTFTASTNATNGYTITVNGTTLTSGGDTITAMASEATLTAGQEEFGLRITASGGNGAVNVDYDDTPANSYALITGNFPDVVASDLDGDDVSTTYSLYYAANIAATTEAYTDYTSTLTYIATGNF